MKSIIYKEKQITYPIFYTLLIIELPLILYFIITGISQKEYEATAIISLIFVVLIFVLVSFFHLNIEAYEDKIIFYFGIFSKIIHFTEIESVEIKKYNFWKYWGWGIRWNPFDNSRAWVARSGLGIIIKTSTKEYFLSSNDPNRLCELINQYLKRMK